MPSIRLLAYVAITLGLLGIVHAPFHSAAYAATDEGAGGAVLPWAKPFRDAIPPAFDFSDTWDVYRTIGSVQPIALVGVLAGLWLVHQLRGNSQGRFEQASFWALFGAWAVFTAATAVEYATPYRDAAFMVGFPAFLLSAVALIVHGIATLRAKTVPKSLGWWLITAGAAFVPLAALFGHLAMATLVAHLAAVRVGMHALKLKSTGPAPANRAR